MVATDPRRDVRGVSIVSISTSPQIARRDVGALGDDGSNGDVHCDVHDCNDNVEEDSKEHPRRGHVKKGPAKPAQDGTTKSGWHFNNVSEEDAQVVATPRPEQVVLSTRYNHSALAASGSIALGRKLKRRKLESRPIAQLAATTTLYRVFYTFVYMAKLQGLLVRRVPTKPLTKKDRENGASIASDQDHYLKLAAKHDEKERPKIKAWLKDPAAVANYDTEILFKAWEKAAPTSAQHEMFRMVVSVWDLDTPKERTERRIAYFEAKTARLGGGGDAAQNESENEDEDEGRECVTMSDGAASISEAVTWPLVFLIWLLGPWACLIGLAIFFGCKLEGILRSSFDDWRARGIITGCRYCPGGKHRRAYFELYINAALQQPAMMMAQPGGVAMQPMMQPMQGQVMMQPMQGGYVQPPMQGQMMMQQPVQGQMMMQQPVQGQMMMQQPAQGQMMMQQPIQGQVMMEQPAQGIAYAQPVVAQGTVVQCSAVPQTAKYS